LTLHETLIDGRARLVAAAGLSAADAAIDVDLFARKILGWDRARLLASQREEVPAALEPRFSEWIDRRTRREPAAYIIGTREFWGLDLRVTPAVLIPRPETEFIVEETLDLLRNAAGTPRVADIGTGSGCLAVALAVEHPRANVVATDLSGQALTIAHENAALHGVADRITFVETSYLDGVPGEFDLIVANPPYVKETDRPALSRDVRHEPEVALFGGRDGLRDLAGVLDTALRALKPGGWLAMEFGYGQDDEVAAFVAERPALRLDRIRNDLQEIPRTAIIQRR
jgi:release factor glutamine methyltransferase